MKQKNWSGRRGSNPCCREEHQEHIYTGRVEDIQTEFSGHNSNEFTPHRKNRHDTPGIGKAGSQSDLVTAGSTDFNYYINAAGEPGTLVLR